jgi:hypothetical protein
MGKVAEFKWGLIALIITEIVVIVGVKCLVREGDHEEFRILVHILGGLFALSAFIIAELIKDRFGYKKEVETWADRKFGDLQGRVDTKWALIEASINARFGHLEGQVDRKLATIEGWVDNKLERIVEHIAIGTSEGRFESVLLRLRDNNLGNLRWALAKFVSHRLYRSFEEKDKEIVIEKVRVAEYSQLLAELISECRHSIYLTCPYTPCKWFEMLDFDRCKDCTAPETCRGVTFTITDIKERARHLIDFFNSTVGEKIRVLNVDDNQYKFFENPRNAPFIESFITYRDENQLIRNLITDHRILMKVVRQNSLNPHSDPTLVDKVNDDFNILDGKLVLMWDAYPQDRLTGECKLILDPSLVGQYMKVFENNKHRDDRDLDKMLERLKGQKKADPAS